MFLLYLYLSIVKSIQARSSTIVTILYICTIILFFTFSLSLFLFLSLYISFSFSLSSSSSLRPARRFTANEMGSKLKLIRYFMHQKGSQLVRKRENFERRKVPENCLKRVRTLYIVKFL